MSAVALPRRFFAALRVVMAAMLCWTIAACGGGGSDSAGGITTPPAIQVGTVTVSLPSTPLEVGATASVIAEVRSTAGAVLGGRTITWSSSAQGVATVSDAGVITGVGVGIATISATSEGKTGTATVTVIQPPVASVVVSIPQTAVLPGTTVQAQLQLRDAAGRPLSGRAVSWTSSNPAIASVTVTGLVSALAPGNATISATSEGQTGQAALQVLTPVASVVISGSTRVKVGDTYSYTVTARAADGTVLERPATWRVRETPRASMTANGSLVPLQSGAFTIVAVIDGTEWDASYTAYDWDSFTSSGTGFLALESDSRVANRFGTLQYTELVMSCGPTARFFLWVRVPHMVTSSGFVGFTFDGGTMITQTWSELSPSYNTLWTPGASSTVKAFAQQVAASRSFAFAFTEFNSAARAMLFRVTGLGDRLPELLALCPTALKRPGATNSADEPSLADRSVVAQALAIRDAARGTAGIRPQTTQDAQARAAHGTVVTDSPLLSSWPRWSVLESTPARRVPR